MRPGAHHEGQEGFLGDLFLNLAAVVIFAIAVVAVERHLLSPGRDAASAQGGPVFRLCGDLVAMEDGPAMRAETLLDSDFARDAVAGSASAPVLLIGAGADDAAFLLAAHLARLGRTELVFAEGGCRVTRDRS